MILEGFEIENWSCIRKLVVTDLTPNGLTVVHGPNGTGKTSIIRALRACLLEYKANSNHSDLVRRIAKNADDPARVAVTFRSQGEVYRITKQFRRGSGRADSCLEQRSGGGWTTLAEDATAAHEQTLQLIGCANAGPKPSTHGLYQLLWLDQGSIHLPNPKECDTTIQTRLREVLGALRSEFDDLFAKEIETRWSAIYDTRSDKARARGQPLIPKPTSELAQAKQRLEKAQADFNDLSAQAGRLEATFEQIRDLEREARERRRSKERREAEIKHLESEYEQSKARLEAFERAKRALEAAETEYDRVLKEIERRKQADADCEAARTALDAARRELDARRQALLAARARLRDHETAAKNAADRVRSQQSKIEDIRKRLSLLDYDDRLERLDQQIQDWETADQALRDLDAADRQRPAPEDNELKALKRNRQEAERERAKLEAAAIQLRLEPEAGAKPARLTIDGQTIDAGEAGAPADFAVRRTAEIAIPGWGHVTLSRGADQRGIDEIETRIAELDRHFAEAIAPYGLSPRDPDPLEELRKRAFEREQRAPRRTELDRQLKSLAPQGLQALQRERLETANRRHFVQSTLPAPAADDPDPTDRATLERQLEEIQAEVETFEEEFARREAEVQAARLEIEGEETKPSGRGRKRASEPQPGLRSLEAEAREALAGAEVHAEHVEARRNELPSLEDLEAERESAEAALDAARAALEAATLTEEEASTEDWLQAARNGLKAEDRKLRDLENRLAELRGAVSRDEGLHQRLSEAESQLEEARRAHDRQRLNANAYDRLRALFNECRDERLETILKPIESRLVRWFRLLRIGRYDAIQFNDAFFPDMLQTSDRRFELPIDDESTGTNEQIALMARLAIGTLLSRAEDPAVALLDDPLAHSDLRRRDGMRLVLQQAARGDPESDPPAGPLQILVFTCHPEWFDFEDARQIDLLGDGALERFD